MRAQKRSLRRYMQEKLLRWDTWLLIACLALVGWSLDALRMFVEMHGTWQGGLAAFAGHFWYAIPMTVWDLTFYQLNRAPEVLGLLNQVSTWQTDWQSQLKRLSSYVLPRSQMGVSWGARENKGSQKNNSLRFAENSQNLPIRGRFS